MGCIPWMMDSRRCACTLLEPLGSTQCNHVQSNASLNRRCTSVTLPVEWDDHEWRESSFILLLQVRCNCRSQQSIDVGPRDKQRCEEEWQHMNMNDVNKEMLSKMLWCSESTKRCDSFQPRSLPLHAIASILFRLE